MNDSNEMREAIRYLKEARRELRNRLTRAHESLIDEVGDWDRNKVFSTDFRTPQSFILSASRDGDCLTMWRGYAGTETVSYAIGLDRQSPLGISTSDDQKKTTELRGPLTTIGWQDVEYDTEVVEKDARLAIEKMIEEYDRTEDLGEAIRTIDAETQELCQRTKHFGFRDERETRVIFRATSDDWLFRPSRFGMTPYICLTGADNWGDAISKPTALPIRAIRVSPGNQGSAALDSVAWLLEANGYDVLDFEDNEWEPRQVIRIEASVIPYR